MSQSEMTPDKISKVLQEVLHLIAQGPSLEKCVPSLMQYLQDIGQADAVFLVVFDQPHYAYSSRSLDWPPMPELVMQASELQLVYEPLDELPQVFAAHYETAVFLPVHFDSEVVAIAGLLFETQSLPEISETELIFAVLNSLKIVVNAEMNEAKHTKNVRHQNEFVRVTTHDLRSPLTVLKGVGGMLEANMMGVLEPHQMGLVEKILTGVNQMEALVDNIQDAGRFDPETGFYELDRTPTDITALVERIVQRQLVPAEKQDLGLMLLDTEAVPILNLDATMIERAIINLVDNAVKYTPNGGQIEVGLGVKDGKVLISVADNGYGIAPEDIRRLFQRHFRIRRREHNRVKGSGLGLFIVRSAAFHHGGDAWVESTEGEGSTFYMSIPLAGDNLLIRSEDL